MFVLCNILLTNDRAQGIAAEIGTITKRTLVTNKVAGVVIAPILTTVSTDFNIEISVS